MPKFSLRGSLSKLCQDVTPVALIAIREWRTLVLSKVFVGVGGIYPFFLSLVFWLFVLAVLIVELISEYDEPELSQHYPELNRQLEQLIGANIPAEPTKYYVVDNSSTKIGELIRREILRRDVSHVVEFMRDKDIADFARALPSINSYRVKYVAESITALKERSQTEGNTTGGGDALISVLVDSINNLERGIDDAGDEFEAKLFANWWISNREYLGQTIPDISSRYFLESIQDNSTLEQLNVLLASKELNAYFTIPEGFPDSNSTIEYVTGELTDSHDRRSVFLLRLWYEELVSGVFTELRTEPLGTEEAINSLPAITTELISPIDFGEGTSSASVSFDLGEKPRYLGLWVRSIWIALFWLAMFYCVYGMSFNTTEEKRSRIAEVLLSNVSHMILMDGKVIGNALVILTLCGSWAVILGVPIACLIALAPDLGSYALRELFNPIYFLNWLVFLLLGITMLGYMLTALGALISTDRVTNLTYLVLGMLFGIGLLTTLDPGSTLASVIKFVPPVTPFAMVSHTTSLPAWPVYVVLLALVIAFLWAIRHALVLVFAKGILLDAVPRKIGGLVKTMLTQ